MTVLRVRAVSALRDSSADGLRLALDPRAAAALAVTGPTRATLAGIVFAYRLSCAATIHLVPLSTQPVLVLAGPCVPRAQPPTAHPSTCLPPQQPRTSGCSLALARKRLLGAVVGPCSVVVLPLDDGSLARFALKVFPEPDSPRHSTLVRIGADTGLRIHSQPLHMLPVEIRACLAPAAPRERLQALLARLAPLATVSC